MRQVFQNLKSGEIFVEDTPRPICLPHQVVLRTKKSLISPGTERELTEFGKAGYLEKARQQPDRVAQALRKIQTDGVGATVSAINSKLDQPMMLGYSSVGEVVESMSPDFQEGQRIVGNGPHADYGRVSANLCAPIPDDVSDEAAAFTVVGAIALQGVRLLKPTIGETYAVYGVGLIGLLAVQILLANGCKVIAVDKNPSRCALAETLGAAKACEASREIFLDVVRDLTNGLGADGVLLSTNTRDSRVIQNSAEACRKRGRIVLVGQAGLALKRDDFFKKELVFQVSSSYGPGRYDRNYEEKGHLYPEGLVRWTARGNFMTVLSLLATGRLKTEILTTNQFDLSDVSAAYEQLSTGKDLGILLNFDDGNHELTGSKKIHLDTLAPEHEHTSLHFSQVVVGAVGAGAYARRFLFPAIKKSSATLHTIVSSGGASATFQGRKLGFKYASSDIQDVLEQPSINTVVIATPHSQHGSQVVAALAAGKNVFVEKPLALMFEEIERIARVLYARDDQARPVLMVGFNRRFSPLIKKMKEILPRCTGPMFLTYTVNAGDLSEEHWMNDRELGGGRLIGEVCHFLDLICHLVGSPITDSTARALSQRGRGRDSDLDVCITLTFEDGSVGNINYLTKGSRRYPKERLEIFRGGSVLQLNNFQRLKGFDWPGFKTKRLPMQDKGNQNCIKHFLRAISGDEDLMMTFEEVREVSTLAITISKQVAKTLKAAN